MPNNEEQAVAKLNAAYGRIRLRVCRDIQRRDQSTLKELERLEKEALAAYEAECKRGPASS